MDALGCIFFDCGGAWVWCCTAAAPAREPLTNGNKSTLDDEPLSPLPPKDWMLRRAPSFRNDSGEFKLERVPSGRLA